MSTLDSTVCTRRSARVAAQQPGQHLSRVDNDADDVAKSSAKQQKRTGKHSKGRTVTPTAEAAAAPETALLQPIGTSNASSSSSTHTAVPAVQLPPSSKARKGSSSSAKAAAGPSRAAEQAMWAKGYKAVAGVDEAGRGPLAGPVVAAAAVLPADIQLAGLNDSKQMSEGAREELYEQLTSHPDVAWAVAVVDRETIDEVNILQAAMLAMTRAVQGLARAPDAVLVDGNRRPACLEHLPMQALVKGDASSTCIAAASVIAKVTRDRLMLELDAQYPQYGFAQHKGYGVPAHKAAIQRHGPCPEHRRSFEPVKTMTGWAGYGQAAKAAAAAAAAAEQQVAAGAAAAEAEVVSVAAEEQQPLQEAAADAGDAAAAAAQDQGQAKEQKGSRKGRTQQQRKRRSSPGEAEAAAASAAGGAGRRRRRA
uniref:Ribonuclease n=1 Tax=Tetradesmus obliquus TaxID=3088 RepID=A0A383WKJ9_TETOB|eukprot:jgi/Sobl393_1/10406/SZX77763.1